MSYPSSTSTLIWAVVKPKLPWIVLVNMQKTLVGTGVETCARLRIDCYVTAPCTTVVFCGASVGGLWSTSGDSVPYD